MEVGVSGSKLRLVAIALMKEWVGILEMLFERISGSNGGDGLLDNMIEHLWRRISTAPRDSLELVLHRRADRKCASSRVYLNCLLGQGTWQAFSSQPISSCGPMRKMGSCNST
jgi:hypothetical protein